MKKIFDIVFTAIIVIVLLFAFLLVGVRIFGLKPYVVTSGSMEPNYPVGSLVYVKKVGPNELQVKDTITYVIGNGTVVTHRIVEVLPDEDDPTVVRYRTKGDANDHADGTLIHFNNVLGKVTFCVPIIGFIAHFVQTPPGCYLLIVVLLILVLLSFLPNIISLIMTDKTISARSEEQSVTEAVAAEYPQETEPVVDEAGENPEETEPVADADEPVAEPTDDTACQEGGNEND
jgi:signal peptidase